MSNLTLHLIVFRINEWSFCVDLRGTPCEPTALHPPEGTFQSSVSQELFHPTSLFDVLQKLSDRIKKGSETYPAHLFPSHDPFFLHIADLNYTIPSANRQATLRSLLDNLRNYGTPTSVSSSPPLDIRNIGRMSTVAAVEARRHASVQSSNAFYAQIPQTTRKRGRLPTWNDEGPPRKAARSVPGANRNDVDQSPNPLMLYRPPPCWDMLQIAAMRVQVSRGEKKPPSKIVGVLHGEGARKKLKVRESIQSVWNLIERRKTVGDTAPFLPESRTTTATGANPFSRKISKVHRIGDLDPSLKASVVNENGKDKAPEKGTGRKEFERSTVARSTFVLPPRSTKPLQPISTLAVPSLPLSMRAKPKPPPPPLRKSRSTGGAQTTLRSHFKESERDARKRQVGEVGPSNSIYSTKGFEEKSKKEKKRKTGGGGFDWGTWSGTPR